MRTGWRRIVGGWLLCCTLLPWAAGAQTTPLVADLSGHAIEIHSAFTGTELLLYGARFDAGDLVAVIRGPYKKFTVRKKERVAGLWVNRAHISYPSIPQYYLIASTKPLQDITEPGVMRMLGIGYDVILRNPRLKNDAMRRQEPKFREALLQERFGKGLFSAVPADISFIGDSLFKTVARFPESIPRGYYTAEVYLFRYGELMGMHTTPLQVYKTGLDAAIYDLAHQNSVWYGLLAIVLAAFAGWLAGVLFKKS